MGQSTNAILFYGYCWDEEAQHAWELHPDYDRDLAEEQKLDDEDAEERYVRLKRGLNKPAGEYDEKLYGGYLEAKHKLLEKLNVEHDTHCSGGCPMPYVAIKSSVVTAWRGHKIELQPDKMFASPHTLKPDGSGHWATDLREYCELMQIPVPDEDPKWWLVSYWG